MENKVLTTLMRNVYSRSGLIALSLAAVSFHVIAYYYVRAFYEQNLPHYDSIGSYITMFETMTRYNDAGLMESLPIASANFMSWLQGFFALFGAAFLNRTPEDMQLLNSFTMLAFMLSIYAAAREYGSSQTKSYLLALMVFLPDVFYDWWGGSIDMRRDFAFVSLLGATFFMFFAFVQNRRFWASAALGLLAGLTVYSRDNAFVFLIIIMGPIVTAWLVAEWRESRFQSVQSLFPAIGIGMMLILPWLYFNLGLSLARRLNPFVMYGGGDAPWNSFMAHWAKPIALMFGRLGTFSAGSDGWHPLTVVGRMLGAKQIANLLGGLGGVHATLPVTAFGLSVGGAVLWGLKRKGYLRFQIPRQSYGLKWIVAGGIWALVATYLVICFIVGLKALDYSSSQIPFFPSLLFFFSLFFAIGLSVSSSLALSRKVRAGLVFLATILVLASAILRMEVKAPEPTKGYVGLAHHLAEIFIADKRDVSVAYLWHDTISYDTLRFYSAQSGAHFDVRKFLFSFEGQWLDFAVGVPPGVSAEMMSRAAHQQIEQSADYVVLCTSAGAYSRKGDPLFLFEYGQPMVDALIVSARFVHILDFEMWGQSFVVLKRRNESKIAQLSK